ncbi:hypothetical protein BASA81_012841 [Batrachochytrium salamandrivorans]|nr:hypothetical protein BASA81_012841 [Batrachochytrium salamandrivorans]
MLKVPAASGPSSATTPFVVITNPSNPFGRLSSEDEIAVATKTDNPKKRAVIVWNDTLTLEGKNHGKAKLDHPDRKLDKYYVFSYNGKEAVCLNSRDAEGAFVVSQKIKDEPAQLGASSFAPYLEGQNENGHEEGEYSGSEDEDGKPKRKPATFQLKKQEFGSKKQQTRVKRILMGRISGAAVVDADELNLVDLVQEDEDGEEGESGSTKTSPFLPPYDEKATEPKDAYPSHGYFPPEERAQVQLLERQFLSNFASQRHTKLEQNAGSDEAKLKKRYMDKENLIVYFELLMRLQTKLRGRFVASVQDGVRALELRGLGEDLMTSLLSKFMEIQPAQLGGGFAKTKSLSDKLCMYLLVIALAIEDYSLNKQALQLIAGDLKVDPSTLSPLLAKLGCKSGTEAGNGYFKLVVPLKFPTEMRKRAKRRG